MLHKSIVLEPKKLIRFVHFIKYKVMQTRESPFFKNFKFVHSYIKIFM